MQQLPVQGPLQPARSARFLEGRTPARHPGAPDGVLRFECGVEGSDAAVGVAVAQEADGTVTLAQGYGLTAPTPAAPAAVADAWRPCRSWAAILPRAAREERTAGSGGTQSSGRTPEALVPRAPEVRVKATRWPSCSSR